jgi:hypothetical protein
MLHEKEKTILTQQADNLFKEITYVKAPLPEVAYDSGLYASL